MIKFNHVSQECVQNLIIMLHMLLWNAQLFKRKRQNKGKKKK